MPHKLTEEEAEELHKAAIEQFTRIEDKESYQRELAVEDMRFVHVEGAQWDDDAIEKRANRPRYTINRVAPAIDQMVGNQRQNRTSIKIVPDSAGADEDTAKIFNGLIRNIETRSKAENSYDSAFDENITGGYGGWRIITELNDDDIGATFSNEQDIKIKPIKSAATSLYFDVMAEEYDKRDANHAFLITDVLLEDFKKDHPDTAIAEFKQNQRFRSCQSWFQDKTIRIAEYWVKTPIDKEIALMSNGTVIDLGEEQAVIDELQDQGITVEKTRKVKSHKVQMYKMNGAEIYEGPTDWAGKYIPLVPEYGKITHIENKTFIRGLTRFAKDPQRIYNFSTSANIEAIALSPKDPIWITSVQAAGYEEDLKIFNTKNSPFMFYEPDEKVPGPPSRTGAPSVQTALIQTIQQSADDIHAATGIYPPALGNAPQLLSEKSVRSQAEMGDRGVYIFQDNHTKSIEYTAEMLVDLIPRIIDTARAVKILNIDGSSETVQVNQKSLDDFNQPITDEETGEVVIVNDLTKGKYSVVASTGPAFDTMRQENANQLIELATGSPVFEQLATDLIAKNLNLFEGDELVKRVRKMMINQGLVEPTEEEIKALGLDQPPPPDPQQTAITDNINMQTVETQSRIELNDAKTQKEYILAQQETVESFKKLMEALKAKAEAGIPITLDDIKLEASQQAIVELSQDQAPV